MRADETSGALNRRMLPALEVMKDHAMEAGTFLKALANEQRLSMLCCLIDGALSVGEINARVPLSQSALSQHLAVLREAGLVATTRKSQAVYYSLAQGPTLNIMEILYSAFCASSASRTRAKKARVKSPGEILRRVARSR